MIRASTFGWVLFALLVTAGCAPEVGDACETGLDCSSQSTRICDLTQRGGYCTLPCERGTCPEEAVCVLFRPNTLRLATGFCMYECKHDSDCREDQGYACLHQNEFGLEPGEARNLDGRDRRFCALPPQSEPVASEPDDDDDDDDAGADASGD